MILKIAKNSVFLQLVRVCGVFVSEQRSLARFLREREREREKARPKIKFVCSLVGAFSFPTGSSLRHSRLRLFRVSRLEIHLRSLFEFES